MKGGAQEEARSLVRRVGIQGVEVIRIKSYSPRFYLLFDADDALRRKLHSFAERWKAEAELIDVSGAF